MNRIYLCWIFTTLLLLSTLLFDACQSHPDSQNGGFSSKFTSKDTTDIIQSALKHKQLDSLLNFAFKNQTLKIVTNGIIKHPFKLIMHGKSVKFTQVDSSSSQLRVWNKPIFYAKITILRKITTGVRLVVFFESIGLFGEYKLQKNESKLWEITDAHFVHT